jgi:flagellar protein FliS
MDDKKPKAPLAEGQTPVGVYRKTDVMTANKETILLMMYSGAIRFLKRGIVAAEANRIEERTNFVSRTQAIVTELRSTLNFQVGGEVATQLDALYAYANQRLTQGNTENNIEMLKEVLTMLQSLNEGWEQAIDNVRKERAQNQKPAEK